MNGSLHQWTFRGMILAEGPNRVVSTERILQSMETVCRSHIQKHVVMTQHFSELLRGGDSDDDDDGKSEEGEKTVVQPAQSLVPTQPPASAPAGAQLTKDNLKLLNAQAVRAERAATAASQLSALTPPLTTLLPAPPGTVIPIQNAASTGTQASIVPSAVVLSFQHSPPSPVQLPPQQHSPPRGQQQHSPPRVEHPLSSSSQAIAQLADAVAPVGGSVAGASRQGQIPARQAAPIPAVAGGGAGAPVGQSRPGAGGVGGGGAAARPAAPADPFLEEKFTDETAFKYFDAIGVSLLKPENETTTDPLTQKVIVRNPIMELGSIMQHRHMSADDFKAMFRTTKTPEGTACRIVIKGREFACCTAGDESVAKEMAARMALTAMRTDEEYYYLFQVSSVLLTHSRNSRPTQQEIQTQPRPCSTF